VSDRGNIKFHTMTVHKSIVYLVGTNEQNGSDEIAIIGIDAKTGIVYSSKYEKFPAGDHHMLLFSETITVVGLTDHRYLIWLSCIESHVCDVMMRSFTTGEYHVVRELVPEFKNVICDESFQLVNLHSENMEMIEFGVKCENKGKPDSDWLFRIDEADVSKTVVHGYELKKADSVEPLHELFAARDYSEMVFSIARVYRYAENSIVLEVSFY
jgi:hypothetical protein